MDKMEGINGPEDLGICMHLLLIRYSVQLLAFKTLSSPEPSETTNACIMGWIETQMNVKINTLKGRLHLCDWP